MVSVDADSGVDNRRVGGRTHDVHRLRLALFEDVSYARVASTLWRPLYDDAKCDYAHRMRRSSICDSICNDGNEEGCTVYRRWALRAGHWLRSFCLLPVHSQPPHPVKR
jgi:hypothetical protein